MGLDCLDGANRIAARIGCDDADARTRTRHAARLASTARHAGGWLGGPLGYAILRSIALQIRLLMCVSSSPLLPRTREVDTVVVVLLWQ